MIIRLTKAINVNGFKFDLYSENICWEVEPIVGDDEDDDNVW